VKTDILTSMDLWIFAPFWDLPRPPCGNPFHDFFMFIQRVLFQR